MSARWFAWVIWAALAGSLVFWGLRLFARPAAAPPLVQTVSTEQALRGDVLRMLGVTAAPTEAAPAAPALAARFKLIGAVASTGNGASWAVLGIDDKPARAFRVGAVVDGELVLQSVTSRNVTLGPAGGAAQVTLELPQLPPPATGTLPVAGAPAAAGGVAAPAGAVPMPGQDTSGTPPPALLPGMAPSPVLQQAPPGQDPAAVPPSQQGGGIDPNQAR